MIDTIQNIREQAEKIKEIVRLQEIKEKGLSNNRQTREQADLQTKPTAEEVVRELE